MDFIIKQYNALNDDIINIRTAVFIKEQGFKCEFDDIDKTAVHIAAYHNNKAVGVCRFFTDDKIKYHIGRVAVLPQYRKNSAGSFIVEQAEEAIKSLGGKTIYLSAQCRVSDFYEKLGYKPFGDVYKDEYCLHIMMKKDV